MSEARLVITAVTVEKRPVGEVAKSGGTRSRVHALLTRYKAEGEAAFEPLESAKRPKPTYIRFEGFAVSSTSCGITWWWWCPPEGFEPSHGLVPQRDSNPCTAVSPGESPSATLPEGPA